MSIQTFFLAVLVVVYGAAQYFLAALAIRDLLRRPSVRGGNKTVWGIVILTLPIAGALLYTWMGPTSFLRRSGSPTSTMQQRPAVSRRPSASGQRNITPITALREERDGLPTRSARRQSLPRPVPAPAQRARQRPPDRLRRTGS